MRYRIMSTNHSTWRKSSYSSAENACVELRGDLATLRDSKNPGGPILRADLAAFVAAVKDGRING